MQTFSHCHGYKQSQTSSINNQKSVWFLQYDCSNMYTYVYVCVLVFWLLKMSQEYYKNYSGFIQRGLSKGSDSDLMVLWYYKWLQLREGKDDYSYVREKMTTATWEKRWLQLRERKDDYSYVREKMTTATWEKSLCFSRISNEPQKFSLA